MATIKHPFDGGRILCAYWLSEKDSCILQRTKRKKKQEWESHKIALDVMKESKGKYPKQPSRDEREVVYSQIAQNMEKWGMW